MTAFLIPCTLLSTFLHSLLLWDSKLLHNIFSSAFSSLDCIILPLGKQKAKQIISLAPQPHLVFFLLKYYKCWRKKSYVGWAWWWRTVASQQWTSEDMKEEPRPSRRWSWKKPSSYSVAVGNMDMSYLALPWTGHKSSAVEFRNTQRSQA